MCKARMIENGMDIPFFHDTAWKKAEHPLRNKKTVIPTIFLFRRFVGNHPIDKQTLPGAQIKAFIVNLCVNDALQNENKLYFLMPVEYPEPFIRRCTYLAGDIKHQKRKVPAVMGIVRINGRRHNNSFVIVFLLRFWFFFSIL